MKKGFTLVELLAVIIILGIIALIATISVNSILSNSKTTLSEVQRTEIEEAAELYNVKEGMIKKSVCTLSDSDGDRVADVGEVVTCTLNTCINLSQLIDKGYIDGDSVKNPKTGEYFEGSVQIAYSNNKYSYKYQETTCDDISENFYVVENNGTKIQMLTEYNIDIITYRQSSEAQTLEFSSSNYWTSGSYSPAGDSEYNYVYDSNSSHYPVVEGYVSYLNSNGVSGATGKLMSYEQAIALGCVASSSYSCTTAPAWVYSVSYRLGSASYINADAIWYVTSDGVYSTSDYYHHDYACVRPVITMPLSNLN